jgi:hypothetical protein
MKTFLIAVAFVAGSLTCQAFASPAPACNAGTLYVIRYDRASVYPNRPAHVEAYCGAASEPVSQFPLLRPLHVSGFDHDDRGDLFVLQTTETEVEPATGYLTVYAPDGHVLGSADVQGNAFGLAIDRTHRKAYIYSPQRSEQPMEGTSARFVRWSGRFAVFNLDPLGQAGYVETDQTENAADFFVDRNARLWIYDNSDRGLISLQKRLSFNTCAMALGADGTLFAISCEGMLTAINASTGAAIDQRDLGTGPVFGGLEAKLALDSNGNVYLYNGSKNTLSCYERGKSHASSVVSGWGAINTLLIDRANDVYVSGFDASKTAGIDVYRGCGLQFMRKYPFYAAAMTLVPAI